MLRNSDYNNRLISIVSLFSGTLCILININIIFLLTQLHVVSNSKIVKYNVRERSDHAKFNSN